MKCLVTGATGFIGAALVAELLKNGHEVSAIARNQPKEHGSIHWHSGDITDIESLKPAFENPYDVLFHVAGLIAYDDKMAKNLFAVNAKGTEKIMSLAVQNQIPKVLHVSSISTFGPNQTDKPMDENTLFAWDRNLFPYHASKYEGEQIALSSLTNKTKVIVVNPAFVFGEGDDHSPAMQLIQKLKKRKFPFYPPGGSCFVWVGDVVKGILLAAEKGRAGEKYILGGENLTHRDAYQKISEMVQGMKPRFPFPTSLLSLYGFIAEMEAQMTSRPPRYTRLWARLADQHHFFTSQKAEKELGYTFLGFEETMKRTILWLMKEDFLK